MEKKVKEGCRFGHLTVESDSGERKNGYIVWNCRCDCGNLIRVDMRTLRRGTVTDCGCITKLQPGQRDITGERFGMLTAVSCTGKVAADGSYIWHLVCDCGGEIDAPLKQLVSGYRRSCGCLSHPPVKDFIGKKFGQLTVIEYAGKEEGIHRWKCVCTCGKTVIVGQNHLQNGHTRSCGCLQAQVYRENLKLVAGTSVTMLEARQKKLNANNTSGTTGVYLNRRTGKWFARIGFRGKSYNLGAYRKKEDAIRARHRGEQMHQDFLDWYYEEYLPGKETEYKA